MAGLDTARNDLTASLEAIAITPAYRELRTRELPGGASAHRIFWYTIEGGDDSHDFGVDRSIFGWRCTLWLYLRAGGKSLDELWNLIAAESVRIMRNINTKDSWSNGVDLVRIDGFDVVWDESSDDVTLAFRVEIRAQET